MLFPLFPASMFCTQTHTQLYLLSRSIPADEMMINYAALFFFVVASHTNRTCVGNTHTHTHTPIGVVYTCQHLCSVASREGISLEAHRSNWLSLSLRTLAVRYVVHGQWCGAEGRGGCWFRCMDKGWNGSTSDTFPPFLLWMGGWVKFIINEHLFTLRCARDAFVAPMQFEVMFLFLFLRKCACFFLAVARSHAFAVCNWSMNVALMEASVSGCVVNSESKMGDFIFWLF